MAAGSKILAGDNPPFANDYESTDETITSTTYTAGSNVCGMTFVAPTSGSVVVFWSARCEVTTSAVFHGVSVQVATGTSIGSGSVVTNGAASDNSCIETRRGSGTAADTRIQASMFRLITGLTPGASYNAVVMMRMINGAGTGTIYERGIFVMAVPA